MDVLNDTSLLPVPSPVLGTWNETLTRALEKTSIQTVLDKSPFSPLSTVLLTCALATFLVVAVGTWRNAGDSKTPPCLPDAVPYLANAWQFMTNVTLFEIRAAEAFKKSKVFQFWLGTKKVYMVTGPKNIQALFRSTASVDNYALQESVMPTMWRMPKNELALFTRDRTGRGKVPLPGRGIEIPQNERHWYLNHHVWNEYLIHKDYANHLALDFYKFFTSHMEEKFPVGEWSSPLGLVNFFRVDMAKCAMSAVFGTKLFELNPNFIEEFWKLDEVMAVILTAPLPKFLNPKPYKIQARLCDMMQKWLDNAWANFDWEDEEKAESHWDEYFGARVSREAAKWMKSFCMETQTGFFSGLAFGQNANTVPMSLWCMMEIVSDPSLLAAVREEVLTAYDTDPETGAKFMDTNKITKLPLLQSVYTETMRVHMSINLMRAVVKPMELDGYQLQPDSLLQTPMRIAHQSPDNWGSDPEHPAEKFWGWRHVKYNDVDGTRIFAPPKPGSFFPFGGGASICPGRTFAKQEILMALGMLIGRFDVEVVGWTHFDGTASDRPGVNDEKFAGAAGMPPDRDLKISMKRLW